MNILLYVFIFALGAIVGSFLNVVVLRYNTGLSIWTGRSRCAHTGEILPWYDLVPILSYIALRGRSRFSGSPLSIQYPLVELLTAVIFVLIWWQSTAAGLSAMAIFWFGLMVVIFSLLVAILAYDAKHKIIPNDFVFPFIGLSFAAALIQFFLGNFSLIDLAAGPVLFVPFFLLWFLSRGTWMGFGDAKLAIGMGFLLGLISGIAAVIWAFWIGAAVSIVIMASQRFFRSASALSLKSEVPFAPFLIIGTLLAFFLDSSLLLFF